MFYFPAATECPLLIVGYLNYCWRRGGAVVKVLRYNSEGLWFDSRW